MNKLKKIYCRAYQFGFRLALPILPYRIPARVEGFAGVPDVLKKHGKTRVLLITDPGIYKLGLTTPLEDILRENGVFVSVYKDTCPNPTFANIEAALEQYRRDECQALIAFGGGSSMDCAKGCGARIAPPNRTLKQLTGILRLTHKLPLLIAVPTTAGTGSETTLAAVLTDEKTHYKAAIYAFQLIPDYAVLEPQVTLGLPPFITATTGMDAMTHAIEAFIGQSTTEVTRAQAIEAVNLILRYLPRAYHDGSDVEARAAMLRAANLAGAAFTVSYVGYVHAVAHSLGGMYGIAHGLANSVLLPIVLEDYGECVYHSLTMLGRSAGLITDPDISDEDGAKFFIAKIREMNREFSIPETLEGIRDEDIPELSRRADREANPLYPVPTLWNAQELQRIYRQVQA